MGYSQHAGLVIVADGSPEAARRLERVLWNDPATGVMRHADAGYAEAIDCARKRPGLAGHSGLKVISCALFHKRIRRGPGYACSRRDDGGETLHGPAGKKMSGDVENRRFDPTMP